MDVAHWLRRLGLERYEAAFRENDISTAILPTLTAEDLRELGVTSVGHRRTLLEAIAALRADPGAIDAIFPAGSASTNSSTWIRRGTPPTQCNVLRHYRLHRAVIAFGSGRSECSDRGLPVARCYRHREFGGFIARYVGDGILVYFGWPMRMR